MAELAAAISDHKPAMSDRLRSRFLDRVHNRDGAGFTVTKNQGKAVIRIYDVIGWPFIEAQDVAAQLDTLTDVDEIEVQINSPGGDAFEGIAIYNALRLHPAKVTTRVDGLAASAASIVAQAGDHRIMLVNTEMMIHEAWLFTIGPKGTHAKSVDILTRLDTQIADLYESHANQDGFAELMEDETWFTPAEAIAAGLADEEVIPETPPKDQAPQRFVDQLQAAIAAVEEVTAETGNVVTFRAEQGKPPLSDDAVALVTRAKAALKELTDVAQSTSSRRDDLLDRVRSARDELDTKSQQLEKYQ
jgi:ATP-dependent protease ClpP protease subunit